MKKNSSLISMFKRLVWLLAVFLWLEGQAQTVYVTKTGKKFHTEGCQYLSKSAYSMTYADALAAGYEPCNRCSARLPASSGGQMQAKRKKSRVLSAGQRCQGITKKGKPC